MPHTGWQCQCLLASYEHLFPSPLPILTLNLECGWLQPLVDLESAFYFLVSGLAISILKVLDLS